MYSKDKIPTLFKWVDTMLTVDAVKSVAMNPDSLKHFYETAKASNYIYMHVAFNFNYYNINK